MPAEVGGRAIDAPLLGGAAADADMDETGGEDEEDVPAAPAMALPTRPLVPFSAALSDGPPGATGCCPPLLLLPLAACVALLMGATGCSFFSGMSSLS